eukprot:3925467-Pyramimonas_sp.AAC.1
MPCTSTLALPRPGPLWWPRGSAGGERAGPCCDAARSSRARPSGQAAPPHRPRRLAAIALHFNGYNDDSDGSFGAHWAQRPAEPQINVAEGWGAAGWPARSPLLFFLGNLGAFGSLGAATAQACATTLAQDELGSLG